MPYLNAYNMQIAQQLRNIDQNHINRIQAISETNEFDVRSPLEATALVNENIHGGSSYSAATVMDMGFEPTAGATPATGGRIRLSSQGEANPRGRTRSRKNLAGQVCQVVEHLVAEHQAVEHQEVASMVAQYYL